MTRVRGLLLSVIPALFLLPAYAQNPGIQNQTASLSLPSETAMRQIAIIESQLIELRKVYTENHPVVRRLAIQLQELRTRRGAVTTLGTDAPATSGSGSVSLETVTREITAQTAVLEVQLVELRKVYSENHPDIRKLETLVQMLRTQLNALTK